MPAIKAISDWNDKTGTSIQNDEFFLKESEHPGLYWEAREAFASGKRPFEPIEQLSPKGLALLSHLYAEKDGNEKQPIIASTKGSLKHIMKLVSQAPIGTQITVIFQMTDAEGQGFMFESFGTAHKSVLHLEKKENQVEMIQMDSTNSDYTTVPGSLAMKLFRKEKMPSSVLYIQTQIKNPEKNNTFSRQMDGYQCGVFAVKDARELNRSPLKLKPKPESSEASDESDESDEWLSFQQYDLPPSAFKSIQYAKFSEHVLAEHGDKVFTSKGRTLRETHEKHSVSGYVQHFSEKYRDMVNNALETHRDSPEKIRAAVETYDAAHMTAERLAAVYSGTHAEDEEKTVLNTLEIQIEGMHAELEDYTAYLTEATADELSSLERNMMHSIAVFKATFEQAKPILRGASSSANEAYYNTLNTAAMKLTLQQEACLGKIQEKIQDAKPPAADEKPASSP